LICRKTTKDIIAILNCHVPKDSDGKINIYTTVQTLISIKSHLNET